MKKLHNKTKKQIHFNPSNSCNLECSYCYNPISVRKYNYQGIKDVKKIASFFNRIEEPCTVVMCGGEPFFQKNLVEFCSKIMNKHYIEIVTNLTFPLNDFFDFIPPERVVNLSISLHIDERNRIRNLNSFINKIYALEKKRFHYQVSQVITPDILDFYEDIYEYMMKKGIMVYPKVFEGTHDGKRYPMSYNIEQKNKILSYINKTNTEYEDVRHAKDILLKTPNNISEGLFSFEQSVCTAGYDDIIIQPDGSIWRCWTNNDYESDPKFYDINHLGNINGEFKWHDKPKPCTFRHCYSPLMGFECTGRAIKGGHK